MTRKTFLMAVTLAAIAASIAVPVAAAPSATAAVVDGTLRISGGPTAERFALRLDALDTTRLQVDVGDDGSADHTFGLDTFRAIEIEAGNGNDSVRIDQINGAFTSAKATRINGGNGDDTLIGGSGAEVLSGGNGDDVVDGNGGADTGILGRGDDIFVWDPGDGSDIVEGERGSDAMVFNGAAGNEIMAASASDGRVLFTRSPGNIVMDLDDVEVIDVRALAGTDTVTVNDVRATDLRRVDVDLAAALGGSAGDGVADAVIVKGTTGDDAIAADADGSLVEISGLAAFVRVTHADPAIDTLVIDTLTGADRVAIDPVVQTLILVSVL